MTEEQVLDAMQFGADPVSLSAPLRDDGLAELGDLVEDRDAINPFDAAAIALLPQDVAGILDRLDPREREVLRLRYGLDRGEPRTLEEVGVEFGLTRERIRQIEARAMSKLRHPACDRLARELLAAG
jgi:RNA polymerase sigma factor (sigma-70 family)